MSFRLPLFAALLIAFSVGTGGACSGCGPTPEDCKNGKDDDQNGKTDCDDAACVGDAACAAGEGEGEGVGEGEGEGGEGEGEGAGPAVEICDPFDFTDEDKVFIQRLENQLGSSEALKAAIRTNVPENARLTFDRVVSDELQDMVDTNFKFYKRVTDDPAFAKHFLDWLFDRFRKQVAVT